MKQDVRKELVNYRGNRKQSEMAEKYGVTQQAWSSWERGIGSPKPRTMKQIEMDSGVSMEILFFDVFNNLKLLKDDRPSNMKQTG
jgi:transcriptional regulator with XRE-family HTH domain